MLIKPLFVLTVSLLSLGLLLPPCGAIAQEARGESGAQNTPASAKVHLKKVNLNTASPAKLQELPGVGPELAKRIVQHREKIGKFRKIEELLNVRGMGEKKFQKIKNRLVVYLRPSRRSLSSAEPVAG